MSKIDGVGVALSGGGFRSFSEVAALEDMKKNDIKIGAVAGTSMGSLLAVMVAGKVSCERIAELLVSMDNRVVSEGLLRNLPFKVLNMLGSKGMVDAADVEHLAHETLEKAGLTVFSDLELPCAIPAVDISSGELCVFTNDEELFASPDHSWICISGEELELARCVCASASYPLVISPTEYVGRSFMDGGCRMNLPTPLFPRSEVEAVVGVGMLRSPAQLTEFGPWQIAQRTMQCGANQLDKLYSGVADVYINLPVSGADAFQAGTGEQVIQEARYMLQEHPVDWSAVKRDPFANVRQAVDAFAKFVRGGER